MQEIRRCGSVTTLYQCVAAAVQVEIGICVCVALSVVREGHTYVQALVVLEFPCSPPLRQLRPPDRLVTRDLPPESLGFCQISL